MPDFYKLFLAFFVTEADNEVCSFWGKCWKGSQQVSDVTRVVNRIKFHFPVSECYDRVDNRIGNIGKIIG